MSTQHIGLEIEYGNLPVDKTAEIIQGLWGGDISFENSAIYFVKNTSLGDFRIELDARPIQKLSSYAAKLDSGKNYMHRLGKKVMSSAESASMIIVPCEIVTPPIALADLPQLRALEEALLSAGAHGTRDSFQYAFGLHINPEAMAQDVQSILAHLQAYLLLEPLLKKAHAIDVTRKMTSFIDPFPQKYIDKVLRPNYAPNMTGFISDYQQHNPTRNRPLDLLPLFAHINQPLTEKLFPEEKIHPRPTYHYRLPNCDLGSKGWHFQSEIDNWKKVEQLAESQNEREQLMLAYKRTKKTPLLFEKNWISALEKFR